jgi:pimeloyl-ACP methyl ester carboxylesterase
MTRFVLVPGGWHGGWAFDSVREVLAGAGHEVQAITLSGLDEAPADAPNLDTHIQEVVQAIRSKDSPCVLLGHSYGGMVITGAADLEPARVQALAYADAYVPESGDSVWSLTSQSYRDRFIAGVAEDGLNCKPGAHMDRRCRPHPMATFLQAIRLTGAWHQVRRKAYIAAFGWEGSPFIDVYERLGREAGWTTHQVNCAHDIPRLAPRALAEILLGYATGISS